MDRRAARLTAMEPEQIEASYGPIDHVYGPSRRGLAGGLAIGVGLFVVGAGIAALSFFFLRVPGERPIEQAGMMFVGGFLALFAAPGVLWAVLRSLGDRLELRTLGVVRRSRSLGLKHCRYADVARIERVRPHLVDLFTREGKLVGIGGFAVETEELIETVRRRAKAAGAPLDA